VSFLPKRGFTCKEIRLARGRRNFYELREALEAFAVEKAIEILDDETIEQLRVKMNSYGRDVNNRFTRERLVFDQDVHLANRGIKRQRNVAKHAAPHFRAHRPQTAHRQHIRSSRGTTAHQEHLRLLAAMEQRDTTRAVAIVRSHIQAGKQNVIADLRQRQAIRELRPFD